MPQIISCTDCGRKLRVPDNLLGKKVRCPGCGVTFVGQAAEELEELEEVEEPPPPPRRRREEEIAEKPSKSRRRNDEEDDDDEEGGLTKRKRREEEPEVEEDYAPQKRKPKKREIYKGWERVRLGVNLVAISIWIMIGGFVGVFLLSCVMAAVLGTAAAPQGGAPNGPFNRAPAGGTLAGAVAFQPPMAAVVFNQGPPGAVAGAGALVIAIAALMLLLYLAYTGVQMTGLGFCIGVVSTPRTKSLKILAVASFGLAVAGLMARGLSYGANYILGPNALVIADVVSHLMTLLYVAEFVCFLFFMRGVAVFMRKDDLARAIVVYMITLAVIIGLSVVGYVVLIFAGMAAAVVATPTPGGFPGASRNMSGGGAIVGCAIILLTAGVSLALLIRFMLLLYQVRSVVDRWLNRN